MRRRGASAPATTAEAGGDNYDFGNENINTRGLMMTRVGILLMIGFVTYITISFCSTVYYDREAAFHRALQCSANVLQDRGADYWIQNGTLLGSTRLGRLILWDAELDIGIAIKQVDGADAYEHLSIALDRECFGFSSTVRYGDFQPQLRFCRKCTKHICAEFHETVVQDGMVITGNGEIPESHLYPLKKCTVADVVAHCPNNVVLYLAHAYGQDWLTRPLATLF